MTRPPEVDGEGARTFGPGYFDLVVVDEAHRSVYAKYGYLFEHFDALLLGLTATPVNQIDRNTFRLFHLEEGVPTDAYDLDTAVADGYLVPPHAVSVGTTFMRRGVRYNDLSPDERDQWDALEWGEDGIPDAVEAEEINRFLFNTDTVDKVLALLMDKGHKVAGGDRIAKTIIFARNQKHADFIAERFNAGWPELGGTYARVITHSVTRAEQLIEKFGMPESEPHIAISVDMLDTGIDVPEVANLVFFKPVRSRTKFWQMIGRGTRLRPELFGPNDPAAPQGSPEATANDKKDFYVFDVCGNLEFFNHDLPGAEGSTQKSLTQRLFETRVGLLGLLDDPLVVGGSATGRDEAAEVRRGTARWLFQHVCGMTLDNVLVRPHRKLVERFSERAAWDNLTASDTADALTLAGLPSQEHDADELAKRFDLIVLRRQVADLDGDTATAARARESLQNIAQDLLGKLTIPQVQEHAELLDAVAGDDWWDGVTLAMLEHLRLRVRHLARFVTTSGQRNPVYTDFADTILGVEDVEMRAVTPGMDWGRFLDKATTHLRAHESHVALQKVRRNRQLTPSDLSALETMLVEIGAERGHLDRARTEAGGLGLFVRGLVGLDRSAAMEAFADFLDDGTHSAEQIRFIHMVIEELTANGVVDPARLYESPFNDDLPRGPDMIFPHATVVEIAARLDDVRATADVEATA